MPEEMKKVEKERNCAGNVGGVVTRGLSQALLLVLINNYLGRVGGGVVGRRVVVQ